MELNTFSIAAYHPDEQSFGVAVSTARPVVGTLVPFVCQAGAIATQARVNTDIGRHGLALLGAGIAIDMAIEGLLAADPQRSIRPADFRTAFVLYHKINGMAEQAIIAIRRRDFDTSDCPNAYRRRPPALVLQDANANRFIRRNLYTPNRIRTFKHLILTQLARREAH